MNLRPVVFVLTSSRVEQDIKIERVPVVGLREAGPRSWSAATEEKIQVTIEGVDIYDPTTGEIRSDSTDEIACWFRIRRGEDAVALPLTHIGYLGRARASLLLRVSL